MDFKLPRTTYIESDLDTDMQIVVNCYDENMVTFFTGTVTFKYTQCSFFQQRRRDLRHRTKVCCSLM